MFSRRSHQKCVWKLTESGLLVPGGRSLPQASGDATVILNDENEPALPVQAWRHAAMQ